MGLRVVACLMAGSAVAGSHAADRPLDEIVVSVQKRAQQLSEVPVAVSAFNAAFLDEAGVVDLNGLVAFTPGFSGRTDDSFTDALSIRGISTNDFGLGGDPSVAIFVDGIHEGRNGGAVTTFLDVAQVEVVRGPQNTLFGRNAIAGAISVTTQRPQAEFAGGVSAAVGRYDHITVESTLNIPLTDSLYFRASGHYMDEDGYLDNLAGGPRLGAHETRALQAALRRVGERTDTTLTLFFEERDNDPSVYWVAAPLDADGRLDVDGAPLPVDKVWSDSLSRGLGRDNPQIFRATLAVEAALPGGRTLTSLTGVKQYDFFYREDYDATAAFTNDYEVDQDVDYFSQELRLNSPDDGPLTWFAGASIYRERVTGRFVNRYDEDDLCRALVQTEVGEADDPDAFTWAPGTTVTGCNDPVFEFVWDDDIDPLDIDGDKAERNINKGRYKGWAVFADATLALGERLSVSFGARYTWDEKAFRIAVDDSGGALGNNLVWAYHTAGFVGDTQDWSGFTPRVALNWQIHPRWSLYANAARGYKSGGFSTFGLALSGEPDEDGVVPPGSRPREFDSEAVVSIEAGVRARLLGDRLQLNLGAFDYRYDDLQLTYFDGASQLTDNVAEASGRGLEGDVRWAIAERWRVIASLAWLDTEIDSIDAALADAICDACAGNELWFAPEWSTSLQLVFTQPLAGGARIVATAEHFYQDEAFSGPDNLALSATPSYSLYNFRLGYDSGRGWSITTWVDNAFDEQYFERGWENADADNLGGYGLLNTRVWPSKPRTAGLRIDWDF